MPLNPHDPRVRKTRRALQEALIRLILRQGYERITIQDIATEAETARITFYRHYRDKESLLMDCLNDLYEDLIHTTEPASADGLRSGYSPLSALYRHIEEHEALYRILFLGHGLQTVIDRMRHHMAKRLPDSTQTDVPLEIVAQHVAGAQIGLAMWWLTQDKPYSADYMARISLRLSLTGLLSMSGMIDSGTALPKPD